ncbi:MAG TPA: hypothetical protein VGB55_14240 [Tepidisphaeraceae bacterium]
MNNDLTANLKSLTLDDVPPFYDEPAEAARDVEVGLDEDHVLIRKPTRRRAFNALHLSNLSKALERLPEDGESWHIVCKGNWPAWSLVPRTLDLIAPARISWLGIATLGFSRDNVDELVQMLDAGDVAKCDLLFSCYFKSNEETLTGFLTHEMRRRDQRVNAIRTHAKIIAIETTDGQGIVVESSANLRSCRNVEQFTITNDHMLLNFHRQWINQLVQRGSS